MNVKKLVKLSSLCVFKQQQIRWLVAQFCQVQKKAHKKQMKTS